MAKVKGNVIGAWAFLIGVIIAIIVGLFGLTADVWITLLLVLGIIVGLLNIGTTESEKFMLAGAVLVIVSTLGGTSLLGLKISVLDIGGVLRSLTALVVPATIIVALKAALATAKR